MKKSIFIVLLLVSTIVSSKTFKEGIDFQVINGAPSPTSDKVTVTEFFSYGCPWCYKLEPILESWLNKAQTKVNFERVPVVFEQGWDYYAKAYYLAKSLGMANTLTPALFKAIQKDKQKLNTTESMITFFVANGADKAIVTSAFKSSPSIDTMVKNGMKLMKSYGINSVPTIVVNGKYKTDLQLAKGQDKRLVEILDYLVAKSKEKKEK
jgi:protein dithiol oxidoreductase (disulfide-forming)